MADTESTDLKQRNKTAMFAIKEFRTDASKEAVSMFKEAKSNRHFHGISSKINCI
jgi:hypothetical protein